MKTFKIMEQHNKMYVYKRIVDAKLFIDQNYTSALDLNQIAETAHYSKFHFLRLFKKCFGMSPNQYLQDLRLKKAKTLLRRGKSVQ